VNRGGLTAALAGLALVVMGVLPPLVLEDTFGDVAVPGSANLHLPDGEVDGSYRPTLAFGHVMRNDRLHWLLTIGTRLSWLFLICVGGVVLCAVLGTVLGLFFTVGTFHLASAVQKLLARPSANL
jgi:hypothetical protein